jgi:hypothetical protein
MVVRGTTEGSAMELSRWIKGGKKSRQRWLWEGGENRFSEANGQILCHGAPNGSARISFRIRVY